MNEMKQRGDVKQARLHCTNDGPAISQIIVCRRQDQTHHIKTKQARHTSFTIDNHHHNIIIMNHDEIDINPTPVNNRW